MSRMNISMSFSVQITFHQEFVCSTYGLSKANIVPNLSKRMAIASDLTGKASIN